MAETIQEYNPIGKIFKKKTLIKVKSKTPSGFEVHNLDDDKDTWVIDFRTFSETYEEFKEGE